jgi:hypothetical protein
MGYAERPKGAGASKSISPLADLISDVSALYLGSLPLRSTATRAALPAMSLAPVAPFAPATARQVMFDLNVKKTERN